MPLFSGFATCLAGFQGQQQHEQVTTYISSCSQIMDGDGLHRECSHSVNCFSHWRLATFNSLSKSFSVGQSTRPMIRFSLCSVPKSSRIISFCFNGGIFSAVNFSLFSHGQNNEGGYLCHLKKFHVLETPSQSLFPKEFLRQFRM